MDLTEADLTEADLTQADLTQADLTEVHLTEVDLTEAQVETAGVGVRVAAPGWPGLAVPSGWEAVAAAAHAVHEQRDAIAQRMTARIAAEVPAYRDELIAPDDLHASVERNTAVILVGIAENRGPRDVEVAACGELGARRALQGMRVDSVIQAFHVGYRELWSALVAAVPPDDQDTTAKLLSTATLVWQWVHRITDAIAATYTTTIREREARDTGARQRFVELLVAGDLDCDEATRLARSLRFDDAGRFVAAVLDGAASGSDVADLQHELDDLAGSHAAVVRGVQVVVISQGIDPAEVARVCRRAHPASAIALGACRPGLRGARASLRDAERTLAVTGVGATSTFEEAWLWATLGGDAGRLDPLLAAGRRVAAEHPHLAAAVRAYGDGGFSVSEAARRLDLHANTVAYRLDRWGALTGWDPRTFAGLTRSLAALHTPERTS